MTASFAAQMNSKPNVMTFVSITIVMMGALMFGIDQTNYGLIPGKHSFSEFWCPKFNFKEAEGNPDFCSNIGEMHTNDQPSAWRTFIGWGLYMVPLGMALGCLTLGPFVAKKFGRRLTISVGGLSCFLGCIIVTLLSNNVAVYMIGRFVTGYGVGIACFVLPMYNAEVATMGIRGWVGSLFQFMVALGCLITIPIMDACGDRWRQGFLLPGYAGLAVGVLCWLCPESPRYIIDRYGKEAGRPVLQRVRQGDIEAELDFVARNLEEEKAAGKIAFTDLFTTPGLRLRVFTACYIQFAQQFTGINAFLGFQNDVFIAAGADPEKVGAVPGPAFYFNLFMLCGCVIGLVFVDSPVGGRRKQLNLASALMGPALIIGAIAGWAKWNPQVTVVALYVFGFGFQFAWGIIPWFYPAELFTMREREMALSLSTCFNFIANIVVLFIANAMMGWSPYATFLIFGVANTTNVMFVLSCVKETKGVPLEDIPGLFGATPGKDSKKEPLSSA